MNGDTFVEAVERLLVPVLEPLGFSLHSSVSGRLYLAEFISSDHVVSISFEPGDEFLQVAVFKVTNGVRSNLDDRDSTPRLSDLNRRFLNPSDAKALGNAKDRLRCNDQCMTKLVKAAHELAVVLPRYLDAG